MRTIIAFVFAGLLIALPAAAQTSGGSGATSGTGTTTRGTTVGVSPSGAGATGSASRNCDATKAGDCETSLSGRYMQLVNAMARIACGSCASK
jgi:hypothetical protein